MVKQDRPDKASWSIWCRLLSLFSSTNHKLHRSLKSWTSFGNSLRQHWPFLYSPSLHLLYHHFENCFRSHQEIPPNLFNFTSLKLFTISLMIPFLLTQLISLLEGAPLPPPQRLLPTVPSHSTTTLPPMSTNYPTTMLCSSKVSTS
jgi:hypothetical protein